MLEKYSEIIEFYRYGIISFLLIFVACLGGIAVAGVLDKMLLVIPIVVSTMLVESLILSLQPMSLILKVSIVSTLISLVTIALF